MLCVGHEAPIDLGPLTRVAVRQSKDKHRQEPDPPDPEFTGREGAAGGGSMCSLIGMASEELQYADKTLDLRLSGDLRSTVSTHEKLRWHSHSRS